jgi:GNAT superfamily N-acetyltransferase
VDVLLSVYGPDVDDDRRQAHAAELSQLLRGPSTSCLVASAGESGELTGFVIVSHGGFFGRDFISMVFVSPAARRTGVASQLLAAVCEGLSRQVWTSTNRSNKPMRSLLERDGWVFSGELEGLDEGDPELVFYLPR